MGDRALTGDHVAGRERRRDEVPGEGTNLGLIERSEQLDGPERRDASLQVARTAIRHQRLRYRPSVPRLPFDSSAGATFLPSRL